MNIYSLYSSHPELNGWTCAGFTTNKKLAVRYFRFMKKELPDYAYKLTCRKADARELQILKEERKRYESKKAQTNS